MKEIQISVSTIYTLIAEFLFTIIPLVIVVILRTSQSSAELIFYNTEWSVISLILFGQSIIKLSAGIAKKNMRVNTPKFIFVLTALIILGILPILLILILNLIFTERLLWLYILQIVFFILSSLSFFTFGFIGQNLLDE